MSTSPRAEPQRHGESLVVVRAIRTAYPFVQMTGTLNPAVAEALDERELCAWRGLLRVHAAMVKALDAELEAQHGLQLSTYEVLSYVADADDGRMRMCDLAASVLLSRSGLTRVVDRLAREGLVQRVACNDDARGAYATLTPAGRELLDAARATHLAGVRAFFLERFSESELDALGGAWNRVLEAIPHSCCKGASASPAAAEDAA